MFRKSIDDIEEPVIFNDGQSTIDFSGYDFPCKIEATCCRLQFCILYQVFRSFTIIDLFILLDFVLVYTKKNLSNSEHSAYYTKVRQNFIKYLIEKHKIQVKEKVIKTDKMEIGFYLLHLSWTVLIEEAERLRLKVPLTKLKVELTNEINLDIKTKLSFFRHFHHKMPSRIENTKNEGCQKDNLNKIDLNKNKHIHFRTSQRQYIMKEILDSVVFREDAFSKSRILSFFSKFRSYNRNSNIRLTRLLNEGVLNSAFPLHDGNIDFNTFTFKNAKTDKNIDRQLLYDHWASWNCIFKFQPINEIENYFGPKVAFYFAWLGFYTTWLFPISVLGVMLFFFGNYDPSYEDVNDFICGENSEDIIMCPLCKDCTVWHLNDICMATQLNRMFDNVFTVLFAFIMNLWAIFFLEFWKRYSKRLGHLWDVLDYERDEEKPSPDYCFYATKERKNPINQELEPYFPYYMLYEKCAEKLTRWEMFRTESEFEDSLILKLFIILSFNYYSHAFYIAFLKGRISIQLKNTTYTETCSHTGCHIEVAFYLFITFVAKQMLKSIYDIAYPRFKRFANIIKSGLPHAINQWENDYQLHQANNLIDNYLYLVLQFGFVNIFVSVFPLGPLFAFIFNILALRINAKKLICESRRMVMSRTNGIGIWFKILESISYFSVLSNALIIAFSSDLIDKMVYLIENGTIKGFTERNLLSSKIHLTNTTCRYFESKYHGELNVGHNYKLLFFKLLFVVVYQNFVSWVQKYIEQSVSDIPRHLDLKIKKENYSKKKEFKNGQADFK
ncbi:unnamed protein product [Brachionus calyciflorus]|uniref:Anoctamin n=1 Tax=Brachionus calyciflorus TaxID=104777 RepID=A0A813VWG1_9BILA|nr:unnamed protein product [Brachionus calyciflorus]